MIKNKTQNIKILIVDDEKTIRESLKDILDYKGYECFEARDGKEALDIIKREF